MVESIGLRLVFHIVLHDHDIQNLIQFKIKSYFITFRDFKPMLSDMVYGLGNQQERGWLQDITIFNENHNAIFYPHKEWL